MSWYRFGLTNIQSAEPGVYIYLLIKIPGVYIYLLIKIPVKKCSHLTDILPTSDK